MKSIFSHAGLNAYCARNPVDDNQKGYSDRISWIFDGKYRVSCEAVSGGELLLEARVTELPEDERIADEILSEAMQCAAYRVHEHAETLVLSEDEDVLLIQQRIPADANLGAFETGLEQFLNATENWRQAFLPG